MFYDARLKKFYGCTARKSGACDECVRKLTDDREVAAGLPFDSLCSTVMRQSAGNLVIRYCKILRTLT